MVTFSYPPGSVKDPDSFHRLDPDPHSICGSAWKNEAFFRIIAILAGKMKVTFETFWWHAATLFS